MKTLPEIWTQFMAAALEHLNDEGHLAERADTAAKLADFAMDEFRKRYPKYAGVTVRHL